VVVFLVILYFQLDPNVIKKIENTPEYWQRVSVARSFHSTLLVFKWTSGLYLPDLHTQTHTDTHSRLPWIPALSGQRLLRVSECLPPSASPNGVWPTAY